MKYGIIGSGVMGGALARSIAVREGAQNVAVSNEPPEKAKRLADSLGCICADNLTVAEKCEYVILAVKPNVVPAVIGQIAPALKSRKDRFTIVSVAAGITVGMIKEMYGEDADVVRLMPNTPVSCGSGVILCCSDTDHPELWDALSGAGYVERVSEKLLETAGTLTGCGPAFAFVIMQALADGAVAVGADRAHAEKFAALTLEGAARLALTSGEHFEALKDKVCSPGGSTIEGVAAMERNAVRSAMIEAVKASYEKNLILGKKK